jgi:signal transduction histidine kinase/CheY-like chemotaxis protein
MKVSFAHDRGPRPSSFEKLFPLVTCLMLSLASSRNLAARGLEDGQPVIRNYLPAEYQAYDQSTAAVQDSHGLVYFGNRDLVLEYDGENWRKIPVPNAAYVQALAIDSNDVIYVGGVNELGYVQTEARGERRFVSLLRHLPAEDQDFQDVFAVHSTLEGIYFTASQHLFRWSNNQFRVWRLKSPGRLSSYWVANHLYVVQPGVGLLRLEGDVLRLVSHDPIFSSDRYLPMMLPRPDGSVLVCTFRHGLYLLRENAVVPFSSAVNEFLKVNQPHSGVLLQNGSVAIATLLGGMIVFHADGTFQALIDESVGLQTNRVHQVLQDRLGSLWLPLGYGISRVELFAPVSVFSSYLGLKHSLVNDVLRYHDQLFAATDSGVYQLAPAPNGVGISRFKLVNGLRDSFTTLESQSAGLLAGGANGVFWIRNERTQRIYPAKGSNDVGEVDVILRSKVQPERFFVGGAGGLRSFWYENDRWRDEGQIAGVDVEVRSIVETEKGVLWLGTLNSGVVHVSFEEGTARDRGPARVRRYGAGEGLPPNHGWVRIYRYHGRELFTTDRGIYSFDSMGQRFQPERVFGERFADGSTSVTGFASDGEDLVWLLALKSGAEASVLERPQILCGHRQQSGVYAWKPLPVWVNDVLGTVEELTWDSASKVLWCGTKEGLLRVDLRLLPPREANVATLIRRVAQPGGKLLFDGHDGLERNDPVLDHKRNSIHFEYAAPRRFVGDKNEYQTYLEGFDSEWSDFSVKTTRDFTNLREAQYRFKVRAREGDGNLSQAASFAFSVQAPWFRTVWAYLLYAVAFGGVIWLSVQLRSQALRRNNLELQTRVQARTVEVDKKNEELAAKIQALKISEQHAQEEKEKAIQSEQRALDASRAKSVFLANMSHELRTPLNAILGFAQLMEGERGRSLQDKEQLDIILRSGEHLLGLINDVLSISKIEAGKQTLHEEVFGLSRMLQVLEEVFRSRTQAKGLFLDFDLAPDLPQNVRGDEGKLRQVLMNLLGNAVKFTKTGGITLRARWRQEMAAFEVEDTGVGISEGDQKAIFEPFMQSQSGLNSRQGTGLGLSICRNFVQLMGGNLCVTSTEGQGSIFSFEVRLPATTEAEARPEERRVVGLLPGQPDYRIVVADDRWENRVVLVKLLASVGFNVREAVDGKETLEVWRSWQPHLIWMDMRMPVMDGMEATRTIRNSEMNQYQHRLGQDQREDSAGAPKPFPPPGRCIIIALTASAFEHNRTAILAAGCDDFVTKPFQNSTVFDKLAKYLGVEFIYEEPETETSSESRKPVLTSNQLMLLPSEWVDQLAQAAALGDDQAAHRIVDQIIEKDGTLGQELRRMVKKFKFEEITQLIQRALQ